MMLRSLCLASVALGAVLSAWAARAADPQLERGKYLVHVIGCGDCHTPGSLLGHPDMSRYLGGSDVGFAVPNGVFVGPNLTSDDATGLGKWTDGQIVAAMTTGVRPDGRVLSPVMPWRDFADLSHDDAMAIAAFLKSLPPISHQVPGPFGPGVTPSVLVMSVLPGPVYASLPKGP